MHGNIQLHGKFFLIVYIHEFVWYWFSFADYMTLSFICCTCAFISYVCAILSDVSAD